MPSPNSRVLTSLARLIETYAGRAAEATSSQERVEALNALSTAVELFNKVVDPDGNDDDDDYDDE